VTHPHACLLAALVTLGAIAAATTATAGPASDPEHARLTATP
jgi:hypothetical protein